MKFVVCIPVLNAQDRLPKQLAAIQGQSLQPEQCIIIDSESSDKSVDIAESYGVRVHQIKKSEFNHGATRSLFLTLAEADVYLYLTDDAMPANADTFKNIIELFVSNPKLGFAYGRQLPHANATPFATHLRLFNYPEHSEYKSLDQKEKFGVKTAFCSDSFAAYRGSALKEIGKFPNNVIVSEDIYVAGKMLLQGWCGYYAADAQVFHSHNYTPIEEFRRYFDIGVFYGTEKWLEQSFGKSGKEGMRYIKSEMNYLTSNFGMKLYYQWFIRNLLKWVGYKLGYYYKGLPKKWVMKLTRHKNYWIS